MFEPIYERDHEEFVKIPFCGFVKDAGDQEKAGKVGDVVYLTDNFPV